MTIALIIIAAASIVMNVVLWMDKKAARKECNQFIADNAALEVRLDELTEKYDNEVEHRRWAIGRIKDQQTVIRQLERGTKPRKQRKEADNEGR
jgi:uncharacterized DUF497 family protein